MVMRFLLTVDGGIAYLVDACQILDNGCWPSTVSLVTFPYGTLVFKMFHNSLDCIILWSILCMNDKLMTKRTTNLDVGFGFIPKLDNFNFLLFSENHFIYLAAFHL